MFKFRKFGLIFTAALLLFFAAACSSGSSSSSGDTIKVGLNLELSGQVASYGSSIKTGAELAVEEINANGGVDGKQLELVPVDNKSEAQESTNAAIKLTEQEKVAAIIGPATSGAVMAEVEVATNNKTPVITPSGTNEMITVAEDGELNEYMFRTCFIDPFQGEIAATFAMDKLGVKKAAVYTDNSSDYAKGLAAAFKQTFEAGGGEIVMEEFYMAKDTDFNSTLTRIKSAEPELIFIPGYYEEVGLIIKQARELGIDAPLIGGDGWDSPTLVELAGNNALNNAYMLAHYASDDPDEKIQSFVEAFKEKNNGESPNGFHALGYDSVYLLADAIERAGSIEGEKIKDALAATKDLSLVTGNFTVDENHNPIKAVTILEFKDGVASFADKVEP